MQTELSLARQKRQFRKNTLFTEQTLYLQFTMHRSAADNYTLHDRPHDAGNTILEKTTNC